MTPNTQTDFNFWMELLTNYKDSWNRIIYLHYKKQLKSSD